MAAAAFVLLLPLASWGQTTQAQTQDRWLHVRVQSSQPENENVRVNVPLDLAEKVLSAINHDHLRNGKIRIDAGQAKDVDIHALFDAIRTARDGEFVTVQDNDSDVRVAKQAGYFLVHVHEKGGAKKEQVEIRIPMKVAEAMLSAGHDELDLLAAVRALSSQGDTELVSVKSDQETVRVWLDSKNLSD
ncbi:MAG: hypothetical protein WA609_08610 [Terriglobales bacterium]